MKSNLKQAQSRGEKVTNASSKGCPKRQKQLNIQDNKPNYKRAKRKKKRNEEKKTKHSIKRRI